MEINPGLHPPPPNDLNYRQLPLINWNAPLYRVHQTVYSPIYFGINSNYRFNDPHNEYGILYAGNDECCAFRETIGRFTLYKIVNNMALEQRRLSIINVSRPLILVDLTGAGLTHIDADGRLLTGEYSISQEWSRAFWEHPTQPDGLYYRSRLDPSRFCFALYNRVENTLSITETINFLQPSFRPRLAEILDTYQYALLD